MFAIMCNEYEFIVVEEMDLVNLQECGYIVEASGFETHEDATLYARRLESGQYSRRHA